MIGINDCWRRYDQNDATPAADYERVYRGIISSAKEAMPALKIIIMEPFLLPHPKDREEWRVDLDPKIHAARKVAADNKCGFVPLDGLFAQAAAKKEYAHWAEDGVHPSVNGHTLIAEAWLDFYFNLTA